MNRNHLLCGAFAAIVSTALVHAAPSAYTGVELQARSNLIVNDNGWNVPPGTAFNSNSATLNDAGQVTFTAGVVPIDGNLSRSGAGLWIGGHGKGQFVAIHESSSPDGSMIIADRPGINATGQVAYYTSDDGGPYTLRRYDPATSQSSPVSVLPLTPTSFANPNIATDGAIGFKGKMGMGYGIAFGGTGAGTLYAADTNVDGASPYAYIYSPASNDAHQIAVKVSTSDYSHNEIRLFNGFGDSRRLVADKVTDPDSLFAGFDNGLGVNNHGAVAVVVKLAAGNVRAIYRFTPGANGVEAVEIARVDAAGTVRAIDAFAPAINDAGLVVFRGSDANGQAVFAGDGTGLVRVVGKGDVVTTDRGEAQLGQHDTSPIFSGAPAVNNHGDIAFVAGVHPNGDNQVEWGTGVFVAYTERPVVDDTVFKDGFDPVPTVEYVYDDGDGDTNQGPPSSFNPDMLWGNYYLAQPGGEVITKISVAFGPTFPSLADGPVTFWLLEDTDGDFDPRNAHAVAHVQATPNVVNDTFFTVEIPPTRINGAFFVGASAKLKGGQDKPARVDRNTPGDKSWFFYAPDIAATIDDLASAPFGTRNDNTQYVPLPGTFMVRATGVAAH